MAGWKYGYHGDDLGYISKNAPGMNSVASLLQVPALGLAGGILREMTLERYDYPNNPARWLSKPVKEIVTSLEGWPTEGMPGGIGPLSHATIAGNFDQTNLLPRERLKRPGLWDELLNPTLLDVGPGNIKIRTAINMLNAYNQMFPDSDPLDLKQYNQRYDRLVQDLKNPNKDTTIKVAGLVAREGQDFLSKAMTPQRWAALTDDQRAAAIVKYYAVGKEGMEDDFVRRGGNPATYTPDFNGDGSDMYFYWPSPNNKRPRQAPNPQKLRDALTGSHVEADPADDSSRQVGDASNPYASGLGQSASADQNGMTAPMLRLAQGTQGLPQYVLDNAGYLTANGIRITPRSIYLTHVLGPQRAVESIRRDGGMGIGAPDLATGQQMRAWANAFYDRPTAPQRSADSPDTSRPMRLQPAQPDVLTDSTEAADAGLGWPVSIQ